MIAIATIALASVQQAPPAPPRVLLECSLVTPAGDSVGFDILDWEEGSDEITLFGTDGSVWPTRTLPGQSGIVTGSPIAARMFAFGSGDGLALDLGESGRNERSRVVTLYRRDHRGLGLPVAYGFCRLETGASYVYRPVNQNSDPREIGANIPAFDPALWPETSCGLVLDDGRRVPFQFSLAGTDQVRLSSPELWAGRPVVMNVRWGTIDGAQAGSFARRGGPEGVQTMSTLGSSAVKLIRLRQIAGRSGRARSGFGICGYNQIVRRPG